MPLSLPVDLSLNPRSWIKRNELSGAKGLSFPPEVDGRVPNFFELKFVNYDRNATLQKANESPNSYTLFLPVPINLSDETSLDYQEYESFGGLDKLLQNPPSSMQASEIPEAAGGFLQAMALGGARYLPDVASRAVASKLGLQSAGNIGQRLGQVAGTQVGAIVNPALAVEFRGVRRKNYSFSWRFIAKSANESKRLASIIDCIRWNTLPEKIAGDWILTYPNIAFMKFHGNLEYGGDGAQRQIIQFAPQGAVCTSMQLTYNGSSSQQIFFDGTGEPVEHLLTLNFADRGILTREQIDAGWK